MSSYTRKPIPDRLRHLLVLALLGGIVVLPGVARAALVADSVAEFSGTQGQDNWFYGFYASTGDSASFAQFSIFSGSEWTGSPVFFRLYAGGGHPGITEWVARRWQSEVTGTVTVSGVYDNGDDGGNGTVLRFYNDGTEVPVSAIFVPSTDPSAGGFSFDLAVTAGDFLDFIIDNNGDVNFDATTFQVTVAAVPLPAAALLFLSGLTGLLALRRRR